MYNLTFGMPFSGTEHELLRHKYQEECALLKKKYLEECSERKRLYNEVIELKGNIRVFCRCRPIKQDETEKGSTSVVDFDSISRRQAGRATHARPGADQHFYAPVLSRTAQLNIWHLIKHIVKRTPPTVGECFALIF